MCKGVECIGQFIPNFWICIGKIWAQSCLSSLKDHRHYVVWHVNIPASKYEITHHAALMKDLVEDGHHSTWQGLQFPVVFGKLSCLSMGFLSTGLLRRAFSMSLSHPGSFRRALTSSSSFADRVLWHNASTSAFTSLISFSSKS